MRVNGRRLDLRSLRMNQPCTITTGVSSITLVHTGQTMQMGMYLKGVAPMCISDQITSIEGEPGQQGPTEWLHLDKLAPKRLYVLTLTDIGEGGRVSGWQIKDATPRGPEGAKQVRPPGLLGRIFRKM